LDARLHFITALAAESAAEPCPCATVTTTLASDLRALEQEVLPWIQYHTELGVRTFWILWDGGDANAERALASLPHVHVASLASSPRRLERYSVFSELHWQWGGLPGNYRLMVKQGFAVNEAIRWHILRARRDGKPLSPDHWLIHMDVDEAILPFGASGGLGNLRIEPLLAAVPSNATALRLLNWEGVPEGPRVRSRLREVQLFKPHHSHLDPRLAKAFGEELRSSFHTDAHDAFLLYGNGKAAARLNTPYLRQWGPHWFRGADVPSAVAMAALQAGLRAAGGGAPRQPAQAAGGWLEVESEAVLLHYPYARRDEMRVKAERSCPGGAGNRSAVDACFVMGFDKDVFLATTSADSEAALDALFQSRISPPADQLRALQRAGMLRTEHAVAATLLAQERLLITPSPGNFFARQALVAGDLEVPSTDIEFEYLLYHE